jgi:hypothetical protein
VSTFAASFDFSKAAARLTIPVSPATRTDRLSMELPERLVRGDFSCAAAAPTIALTGNVAIRADVTAMLHVQILLRDSGLISLCSQRAGASGRAYAHRIPLAGLKCVSGKRRSEMVVLLGGRGK